MRVVILFLFLLFLLRLAMATGVSVQGGPVTIRGGYVDVGATVIVSTTTYPEVAGTCMGLLCGILQN